MSIIGSHRVPLNIIEKNVHSVIIKNCT